MTGNEIRQKFLDFFEKKGHKVMPSSSLIPKNDPSVLFTTAGMQQFKKYYLNPELADKELGSRNIVTVQKCVRTGDIDEVGDNTHLTFFEMLGNFSFGGYGRKEAIEYAHEFITKEMGLEISYVTVYEGSENVPKDSESESIWKSIDSNLIIKEEGSDVFWGPTGNSGPCGPTTEIYCKNASGEDVEIWNIVFNEYFCNGSREQLDKGEANLEKLPVLGVDTGMGFERLVMTVQKKQSVYDTDLFNGEKIKEERVIVDHMRASEKLIEDGVLPANTGAGYVLRRLIRRMVRMSGEKELKTNNPEILKEAEKFKLTLEHGLKEFEKIRKVSIGTTTDNILPTEQVFQLITTYGFPREVIEELAREKKLTIYWELVDERLKEHQKLSQTASAGMFKGGLASHSEKSIKLHTAHHLLLAALQKVVSQDIHQKGSNITDERLRIDFSFDRKLTDEEKKKVEDLVNEKIQEKLNVIRKEMNIEEAKKLGAEMEFGIKYPDVVSVYFVENKDGGYFSKEFCGGPHVANTGELGKFKIKKEEASSAGVRRIKAVLE
ncbi:MAG TPA: alanine--tRNA ligase-related protein [Candidatus Paceibacterota bacterium]|nr:alanine--tRNA ligase-related protein [Candidatus Paceibacterota bacterium]